jgi:putative flippase GtrA
MVSDAWRGHEKLRFLAVGVWNTAFAYLAFFAIYGLLHQHVHYLVVSILAHICAVANAFVCQRILVFQSRTPWVSSFLRFNLVQLLVLIGNLAGLALLVEVFHFHTLLSQLIVMTISVIVSYLMHRAYSFKV